MALTLELPKSIEDERHEITNLFDSRLGTDRAGHLLLADGRMANAFELGAAIACLLLG